jgi:LPS-assembly lipoprotein
MKSWIGIISLALWLSACGGEPFRLHHSRPIPDFVKQQGVYIEEAYEQDPGRVNGVVEGLRNALEERKVPVMTNPQTPNKIVITRIRENRTVSGYSASRQVREFNHTIEVDYKLVSPYISAPIEQTIRAERSQVYNSTYVLGTAEEETAIKQELQQEAVRLMLLRLQALDLK